jgi:aerobic-type carbon monoxide dehydrogenase small subunit (CoxS/CutS family)
MKQLLSFTVNGESVSLAVDSHDMLLDVLRDQLELTGAKEGCGMGECGACTVIMNGHTVNTCILPALEAEGAEIITVEGLIQEDGSLSPIQQAFVENGAVQCGFCTPGMVMSAQALLMENPNPDEDAIRRSLAGNICRCTGYNQIVTAVQEAAKAGKEPTDD